jgi:uncharacterized membrane protein
VEAAVTAPDRRPALAALALTAVAALLATGPPSAGRTASVVLFVLLGPGLGLVGGVRVRDGWERLTLVIGASLAFDLVVTVALVYAGAWSVTAIAMVLGGTAAGGAAVQLGAARRRRARE